MALSCCKKFSRVPQSNNIKSLFKLFSLIQNKNKLKKHESVSDDHDYCYAEMPNEDNKILKYNKEEKSLKAPAIIYANLKCFLEKLHSCQNNPEKSYSEIKTKQTPSGY